MSSTATKTTAVVTAEELTELAEWEKRYADAKKKAATAEKELSFRRIALAEKVLGVKTAEELKTLSPAQVTNRYNRRLENGDWRRERGAPEFVFLKTHEGRYPAWREQYILLHGETEAARIAAETDVTYSYRVEVAAE